MKSANRDVERGGLLREVASVNAPILSAVRRAGPGQPEKGQVTRRRDAVDNGSRGAMLSVPSGRWEQTAKDMNCWGLRVEPRVRALRQLSGATLRRKNSGAASISVVENPTDHPIH